MKNFLHLLIEEIKTLRNFINRRFFISSKKEMNIVNQFHELYHTAAMWGVGNTTWLGVYLRKCPLDLWIYQELIYDIKPDIIIECGTLKGGSALYLASICDLINQGKVITIDIKDPGERPKHQRIKYLMGSSTSNEIVKQVKKYISKNDKIMVVLDSAHGKDHVLEEIKIYSQFINQGSYIIIEDTNINGHPVSLDSGPGPMEAVDEFLKINKSFRIDKKCEKFYMTFNPRGYLKKIK